MNSSTKGHTRSLGDAVRAVAQAMLGAPRTGLVVICGVLFLNGPGRALSSDYNANGVEDLIDVQRKTSLDCNYNLIPDECDPLPIHFGLKESARFDFPWQGSPIFDLLDLEGDGDLDIVTASDSDNALGTLTFLRNQGDGTFQTTPVSPPGLVGDSLLASDLDGDGDADLITAWSVSSSVFVLRNAGDAGFVRSSVKVGEAPRLAGAVDIDRDGDQDVLLMTSAGLTVLLNGGTGAFSQSYQLLAVPTFSAVAADFNADGAADILAFADDPESPSSKQFRLLLNKKSGTVAFDEEVLVRTFDAVQSLAAGDLNGDAAIDFAYVSARNGYIEFFFNPVGESIPWRNGAWVFDTSQGTPMSLRIKDIDGDRHEDLAVGNQSGGFSRLFMLLGTGTQRFHPPLEVFAAKGGKVEAIVSDLDADGKPELVASNWVFSSKQEIRIFEGTMVARAQDCNQNGVPDDCEDCNRNGLADACDIESGRSADVDRDRIPDDCEPPISFTLRFSDPTVLKRTEASVRFQTFVLVDDVVRDRNVRGALGWSLYVLSDGGSIVGATTSGTAGAPVSEGGFRRDGAELTFIDMIGRPPTCGDRQTYVYSGVTLSFAEDAHLVPGLGPYSLLSVEVEAPLDESGCAGWKLCFSNGLACAADAYPGSFLETDFGLAYAFQVGREFPSCAEFRRGDTNSDGRVDLSDAVRTFMYLFLGAAEPHCLDATDSNDDGKIDISDGLHTLLDLFRPGTGIPAPGPFDCGPDPSVDRLGCTTYERC